MRALTIDMVGPMMLWVLVNYLSCAYPQQEMLIKRLHSYAINTHVAWWPYQEATCRQYSLLPRVI